MVTQARTLERHQTPSSRAGSPNPKSEIRNPKEVRIPNSERKVLPQITQMGADGENDQENRIAVPICVHLRYLRFISSIGFRISDFGFQI
jgi:hypothetical protein